MSRYVNSFKFTEIVRNYFLIFLSKEVTNDNCVSGFENVLALSEYFYFILCRLRGE